MLPRLVDSNEQQQHKVRRVEFLRDVGGGYALSKLDEVEYSIYTMPAYIRDDVGQMGVPVEWEKLMEAATISMVSPPEEGGREEGGEESVQ